MRSNKTKKKEINIQLIPVYISDAEFQEHKREVQNLIARMVIDGISRKPGRPRKVDPDDNESMNELLLKPKRKSKI
jgi:hypothetical protein